MKFRHLVASSLLTATLFIPEYQAAAATVGYSFSGTLASGGTVAGTFSYETGLPEYVNDGNDDAGSFLLLDWAFSVSGSPVLVNASYSMATAAPGGSERLLQQRQPGPPVLDAAYIRVARDVELALDYYGDFTDPNVSAALGASPQPLGGTVFGYVGAMNSSGGLSYVSITDLTTAQTAPAAVPLPAALWLFVSGLAGLAAACRRYAGSAARL